MQVRESFARESCLNLLVPWRRRGFRERGMLISMDMHIYEITVWCLWTSTYMKLLCDICEHADIWSYSIISMDMHIYEVIVWYPGTCTYMKLLCDIHEHAYIWSYCVISMNMHTCEVTVCYPWICIGMKLLCDIHDIIVSFTGSFSGVFWEGTSSVVSASWFNQQ